MTYNIHPILVHFPIALLFTYSIIKIIPFKKWIPNFAWKDIERVFLLAGVLGGFAAFMTGDTAEELAHPNQQLVDTHSSFAALSMTIYCALLAGELASIILIKYGPTIKKVFLLKTLTLIEKVFTHKTFSVVLAILGFFAIATTGLLGGIMVYKTTADPLAAPMLKLLGITL